MKIDQDQLFAVVARAIADITNLEAEEISLSDHLIDDLFLNPAIHLPQVVNAVADEYQRGISNDSLVEFIDQMSDDPDKGTLEELVALLTEELEFS